MADAAIVRNGAKIDATIGNAVALLATAPRRARSLRISPGSCPAPPAAAGRPRRATSRPRRRSPTSSRRDLKRRGFRFVGTTIVYAFMQSVGLVDDHLPGCFRYRGEA